MLREFISITLNFDSHCYDLKRLIKVGYFNRDNFLELDVYFEEMQVTLITQRPAYDQESLFGEFADS